LDAGDTRTLRDFNLTSSQYRLLMLLDPHEGQNLIRLSERMLVARSTITRLIDQLENIGIVQRVDDPDDRRAQRVALTKRGAELREQAHVAHEESLQSRFSALSEAEQAQFRALLATLRDRLLERLEG
jgi:DNA-binding MarR family transcriptional regulator